MQWGRLAAAQRPTAPDGCVAGEPGTLASKNKIDVRFHFLIKKEQTICIRFVLAHGRYSTKFIGCVKVEHFKDQKEKKNEQKRIHPTIPTYLESV